MTQDLRAILGRNIVKFRDARKWSRYRLAEVSGIDQANLKRIEDGTAGWTDSTLAAIAKGLGVPASVLLADDPIRPDRMPITIPPEMADALREILEQQAEGKPRGIRRKKRAPAKGE